METFRDIGKRQSNWGRCNPDRPAGLPLHCVLIRDMGMTLGEVFDREALAADRAADGVWEFLFVATQLKVKAGVGTPITPVAIK